MRKGSLKLFFCFLFFFEITLARNPLPFRGSFLMSFSENGPSQKKMWPLQWSVDVVKMGMEVQDDMNKKGVKKRVVYNLADSTWLMLMKFNNVKQGTRIHANAMFRDTMKSPEVKIKSTRETKVIAGYACRKDIVVSKNDSAEVWSTKEINFDMCHLYKLLCHCGVMSSYVDDGSWYFAKKIPGMVMEVTSTNRKSKLSYTMGISEVQPGEINDSYFDLKDFKISDIPEGESCGPAAKENEQ